MKSIEAESKEKAPMETCIDPQTGQLVYTDDETVRMRVELRANIAQIVEVFRKQGYTVNPIPMWKVF